MINRLYTAIGLRAVACFAVWLAMQASTHVRAADSQWDVVVSPTGMVGLEHDGLEVGSIVPGLFEKNWRGASMNEGSVQESQADGVHQGQIRAPGGGLVKSELRHSRYGNKVRFEYRLTPQSDLSLNSLYVGFVLPANRWSGGTYVADGRPGSLPRAFKDTVLQSSSLKSLRLNDTRFNWLQIEFEQATAVLVQDDRQWGQTYTVRIGPQMGEGENWPAGKTLTIAFILGGDDGLELVEDGPITMEAGPQWLPLNATLDIEAGSALDFSQVIPWHAPAGKHGRVTANADGKFVFADRPAEPVRFYGVNLCFSAQYLTHEVADRLADRLRRLGYNALRIHHYESELVDRSAGDEIRLKPDKLDQLDYLLAALKQRGIYVSTDLFVSRPVPASRIYPGQSGDIGMDEYKMAVHVNELAYQDFTSFSKLLLDHVNPYTLLRYSEDPMLAWLSLVNEDNPGNFISQLEGPLRHDWQLAWNRWLATKFKDRSELLAAMGPLPDEQVPADGSVLLQDVRANTPAAIQFNVFLAEVERDFFVRTRRFLQEDLGCQALLTDINAWTNPVQMQAVRGSFDYVDDHFYVDHPQFLERPWSLPSRCSNTSPIADGATGGRSNAFTRLFGKPFTITEFNYSSPGRFRGVGGVLTGALGAIQDWDGVWRFAYAHNRDNVVNPGPLNYFDVAADPLNQAAERASLCLFLRRDMQPAEYAVSITATEDQLLKFPTTARDKTPSWNGLAWLTRVGWSLSDQAARVSQNRLALPMIVQPGSEDPFAAGAEKKIMAELRRRQWVAAKNVTDFDSSRFQSGNGEVTIDAPNNVLILDTERTAGGFAPAGKTFETRNAWFEIHDTDATVWVSSLDDQPISASRRLLITHLTDLQNSGARYGDRGRKVLLDWGRLPHLVQAGRATIRLRLADVTHVNVYGLSTDGKRLGRIETTTERNRLTIPISINDRGNARMLYEVEFQP